jgi:hypothetical protein
MHSSSLVHPIIADRKGSRQPWAEWATCQGYQPWKRMHVIRPPGSGRRFLTMNVAQAAILVSFDIVGWAAGD